MAGGWQSGNPKLQSDRNDNPKLESENDLMLLLRHNHENENNETKPLT
jgi:hypothetical protein